MSDSCDASFTTNENLKKHIDGKHRAESEERYFRKVQCPHCDQTCVYRHVLNNHVQLRHPEEYDEEQIEVLQDDQYVVDDEE